LGHPTRNEPGGIGGGVLVQAEQADRLGRKHYGKAQQTRQDENTAAWRSVLSAASRTRPAPQLRAINAVEATETPIRMAWMRKNTRCPVVTAATSLVPSAATIFIWMNPTVLNSRLEIIVGHARRQTL
jgi:hypothetical protein